MTSFCRFLPFSSEGVSDEFILDLFTFETSIKLGDLPYCVKDVGITHSARKVTPLFKGFNQEKYGTKEELHVKVERPRVYLERVGYNRRVILGLRYYCRWTKLLSRSYRSKSRLTTIRPIGKGSPYGRGGRASMHGQGLVDKGR